MAKLTSPTQAENALQSTGERSHKYKFRFRNPKDLHDRYTDTVSKTSHKDKRRKKLVTMYERYPYQKVKAGKKQIEPNWGRFTDAINEYVKFFASIALDRSVWCRIETYEGWKEKTQDTWSDSITELFHKHCIKPWHKKEQEVISCISDDCFFNRGAMMWRSPFDTYPCYIEAENVFPDTNATTDVDSFNILFVRDKMSAVSLYKRAISDEDKELGWNTRAILNSLASNSDSDNLKEKESASDVLARWRKGDVDQAEQDRLIPVVWCYVKEYKEKEGGGKKGGNQVSVMVIPENLMAMGVDTRDDTTIKNSSANLKRKDYLYFVDYYAKDFQQIITLWTSNIKRGFYNSSSFASQIYLGCVFYDQTMNSIIRSVKRTMRLWIKTANTDTKKKLQQMDPDDEVGYLNQDDDIAQISMKQDVTAATELMRTVSASINQFSPSEFQGTQNSPKGYPITKGEAQILNQQLDDSKSMSIKLFISKNREFCKEIYRRFVNSTSESDTWENYKRFVAELEEMGIPEEAWKAENCEVYARFNQFAGKASANYAAAKALLEATQIKPASKPEERAQRAVIASLTGEANVSEFLVVPMHIDQELFIIGQENEGLDNPFGNPSNFPVTQSDNHMLHIQGHLSDYIAKLTMGNQLLNAAAQDQSYRKQFLIEYVAGMVNAQDNKGAHIQAHFAIMQKDVTKQDDIKILADQFQQAQLQQDQLANKVKELQASEVQANTKGNLMDLEFQHDKRMKDQEFQFTQAMDKIKLEKAVNQTEIAQVKAQENQAIKVAGKQEDQSLKVEDKKIDLVSKAEQKRLDLEAKRTQNSMAKAKAEKQATEPQST